MAHPERYTFYYNDFKQYHSFGRIGLFIADKLFITNGLLWQIGYQGCYLYFKKIIWPVS
jgi:hypothetical protein